jgi:hypothetical protein
MLVLFPASHVLLMDGLVIGITLEVQAELLQSELIGPLGSLMLAATQRAARLI